MGGQEVKQLEECSVSKLVLSFDCSSKFYILLVNLFNLVRFRQDSRARMCNMLTADSRSGVLSFYSTESLDALGTWVFSVAGALLAIPVGIKRKSLAPLVFFGTTGTMLDIIMGISACEREHAERQMKLLEAQNSTADDSSFSETGSDSHS
ncbi:hypothetical protein GOBAR_DD09150 [Gossypium barbadense]|nr:hypothetical protein GOBAR_DD09150 [Gossypium barbadense]